MQKNARRFSWAPTALLVVLGLGLASCDDSSAPANGSLSLLLTDAPGAEIEHAWVEITGIYLQGQSVGAQGQIWLLEESTGPVDLKALADETYELVKDVVVPAGTYAQLRVIIGEAVIETADGKVYVKPGSGHPEGKPADGFLECPSCTETGIKVNMPEGAVTLEDEGKILVLDFDVAQSFGREAGLAGVWVMEPLINGSDFQASGTISGIVSLADGASLPICNERQIELADFVPMAAAGEIEKSGSVEQDGSYKIGFVEPDDYALGFMATATLNSGETVSFEATHPASVTVSSGGAAEADFSITSASCGG